MTIPRAQQWDRLSCARLLSKRALLSAGDRLVGFSGGDVIMNGFRSPNESAFVIFCVGLSSFGL